MTGNHILSSKSNHQVRPALGRLCEGVFPRPNPIGPGRIMPPCEPRNVVWVVVVPTARAVAGLGATLGDSASRVGDSANRNARRIGDGGRREVNRSASRRLRRT